MQAGQELFEGLRQRKRVDFDAADGLARSALRQMDKIHQLEVVHNDIKPENMLVRPDNATVWVNDWDNACILPSSKLEDMLNFQCDFLERGTRNYMWTFIKRYENSNKSILHKANDLFALGVTLYAIFFGGRNCIRHNGKWSYSPFTMPKHWRRFVMGLINLCPENINDCKNPGEGANLLRHLAEKYELEVD